MGKKELTVPVSRRALIQRIRRALAKDGERLVTPRGAHAIDELGEFYISNERNFLVASHCDLESLGRELDVLKPWERVAE